MSFVADTASLDFGSAVLDEGRVEGQAVLVETVVRGFAVVCDAADVANSFMSGHARIYGTAVVKDMRVLDSSCIFGSAHLVGNRGDDGIYGVELRGDCKFGGTATFDGLNTVESFIAKYGEDKVELVIEDSREHLAVIALTDVWDMG